MSRPKPRLVPVPISWRAAVLRSKLPATTKLVAVALSTYMGEQGDSAHPGATRLAEDTSLHLRTVKEKLVELEREGWLQCAERGGLKGDIRRANVYEAVIPVATDHPWPQTTRGPGPLVPVAQDHPISSLISSIDIPPSEMLPEKTSSTSLKAEFEDWWTLWPRKVEKANAKRKYLARRRAGASHDDLCKARDHYVVTVDDVQYCKYAATFLAPETWTEWLTPPITNGHRPRMDFDALSRTS